METRSDITRARFRSGGRSLFGLLGAAFALCASTLLPGGAIVRGADQPTVPGALETRAGWYLHRGRVVWGYAQHNGWWRPGQRPNLTRRAPGHVGPNRTEDLGRLVDNMLAHGYPGFEHNFGLWYDRRRDAHDTARRGDGEMRAPFLEQPWARTADGTAWDGGPRYDLTRYNDWYFSRLDEFARLCDLRGTILLHNHYMQHALLETDAHYVDFPWRPVNCRQATGMPDRNPAASAFWDPTHPVRRRLHRAYIRKCLEVLGPHRNVIHLLSEEYTGPLSFVRFWLDTVVAWEKETGRDVHVAIGAPKDVLDAILADPERLPHVSTIDLRYWWYRPDGTLSAPPGGRQVPGRYSAGKKTSPEQLYRQIREHRDRFPEKGILQELEASRQETWAHLMAGGSMLVRRLEYRDHRDPPSYEAPEHAAIIAPLYRLVREHLAARLAGMRPADLASGSATPLWCLADPDRNVLAYAPRGGSMGLDLGRRPGRWRARWIDPRSGELSPAGTGEVEGGREVRLQPPDGRDWALWLDRAAARAEEASR